MEEPRLECPICNQQLYKNEIIENKDAYVCYCTTCGRYSITWEAAINLLNFTPYADKKHILSGVIREANRNDRPIYITSSNIQQYIDSASLPDSPLEAIDRILLYIYENLKDAASFVELKHTDYPIAYARDYEEFEYLLEKAKNDLEYLKPEIDWGRYGQTTFEKTNKIPRYELTKKGRERVKELQWKRRNKMPRKNQFSRKAFVAMWFDEEMELAWQQGFGPALEETGYEPTKIDLIEHNEKIDDKIVEEIRKSSLLIADFTGHRGGVYYEAGLAKGIGIPVIWTCHRDHIKDIHFDTRQYNHIVWKSPEELKEKLIRRIKATLPANR